MTQRMKSIPARNTAFINRPWCMVVSFPSLTEVYGRNFSVSVGAGDHLYRVLIQKILSMPINSFNFRNVIEQILENVNRKYYHVKYIGYVMVISIRTVKVLIAVRIR